VSCIPGSCDTTLSASLSVALRQSQRGVRRSLSAAAATCESLAAGAEPLVRGLPGDAESVTDIGPGGAESPSMGDMDSGVLAGPLRGEKRQAGATERLGALEV
jgi:hypothetical protein